MIWSASLYVSQWRIYVGRGQRNFYGLPDIWSGIFVNFEIKMKNSRFLNVLFSSEFEGEFFSEMFDLKIFSGQL